MRRFFTHRKTLALVAVVLAIGAIVWLPNRGPREPVFEGKKLGWWFHEISQYRAKRLTREQLQTLGPEAVDWLAYKSGQIHLEEWGLVRRMPMWIHQRWHSKSMVGYLQRREEAINALRLLGPDAAPAVPSLLKILQNPDHGANYSVAEAIMATGAAGWPLAAEAILHSDARTRVTLLECLKWRWTLDPTFGPADFAAMVELLEPLTLDSDEMVRSHAQSGLEDCLYWWSGQPDCAEGVRLMLGKLPGFRPEGRGKVIEALVSWGLRKADVIFLQLTELAATSDDQTRARILHALGRIDPRNPEWVKQLDALATSPDPAVAAATQAALDYRRNRQSDLISPSIPAGSATDPKTP